MIVLEQSDTKISEFVPKNSGGHCWHKTTVQGAAINYICCHCGNPSVAIPLEKKVLIEGHGPYHPGAKKVYVGTKLVAKVGCQMECLPRSRGQ